MMVTPSENGVRSDFSLTYAIPFNKNNKYWHLHNKKRWASSRQRTRKGYFRDRLPFIFRNCSDFLPIILY